MTLQRVPIRPGRQRGTDHGAGGRSARQAGGDPARKNYLVGPGRSGGCCSPATGYARRNLRRPRTMAQYSTRKTMPGSRHHMEGRLLFEFSNGGTNPAPYVRNPAAWRRTRWQWSMRGCGCGGAGGAGGPICSVDAGRDQPETHPNAPAIMIGEEGAGECPEDAGGRSRQGGGSTCSVQQHKRIGG